MLCPFCHSSVQDGKKFCTRCGKRLPACPSCGSPIAKPTKFCISCGTALPESVLAPFAETPAAPANETAGAADTAAAIAAQIHRSIDEESRDIPVSAPVRKHFCTLCGAPCPPEQKLCDACLAKQAQAARPKSFCVRCGTPVAEGETLCPECRVAAARERRSDSEASAHQSVFVPVLIGIIAALLLIIGGIAFWAVTRSGGTDADEASTVSETVEEEPSEAGSDVVIEQTPAEEVEEPAEEVPEETAPAEEASPAEEPAAEEGVTGSDPVENDPDSVEAMGKVDYFIQHCNDMTFSSDYFDGLTKDEARIARNGIYARAGRSFDDQQLLDYYSSHFDWYNPTIAPDDWKDSYFNSYEAANKEIILDYEIRMGYRNG